MRPPARSAPSWRRCWRWRSSDLRASVPVVKIPGWPASSKPRLSQTETRDGVNGPPTAAMLLTASTSTRRPGAGPGPAAARDDSSAVTLNLCRAYTNAVSPTCGGHAWKQDFARTSPSARTTSGLAGEIDRALAFMHACGATRRSWFEELCSSHEALLLDHEDALTRTDFHTGGEMTPRRTSCGSVSGTGALVTRTSNLPAASKSYRGQAGPLRQTAEVLALAEVLELYGRRAADLHHRMGAGAVRDLLPPRVEASAERNAGRLHCEPMQATLQGTGR